MKLGEAFNSGRTLAYQAVATNLVIMAAASILTVVVFSLLRMKNRMVYEPKLKYHDDDREPPPISSSIFGWVSPLVHTKDLDLLDNIGLDAVVFLRFLRLLRTLFTGIAIPSCLILIPVNFLYNKNHPPQQQDLLSKLSIRDVKGNLTYVHIAIAYLITAFVLALVWYLNSFHARTITITHVPRRMRSDAGISRVLQGVNMPYPTTSVHIGHHVGQLPELIEYHNQTVREFERVLMKFFQGGTPRKQRPTVCVGGWCGLGGTKMDAITFYTEKLKRTEAAVGDYRSRAETRKPQSYGFAALAAVPHAHIAARMLSRTHHQGTSIALAPNPKDIIWENMNLSDSALARKQMFGFLWLAVICFLSIIPQLFVSALANLDAVTATGYLTFLDSWLGSSSFTYTIFTGTVPPLVLAFFSFLLPRIMRWLTRYMGALTHAHLDRAVVARYFAFLVISQLIVFTLFGVGFDLVSQTIAAIGQKVPAKEILHNLDKLPDTINRTYINQASFWLKYFPLRVFLALFDLSQILNLLWISFRTRVFGKTPRDIRDWTQPPIFEYAIYYSDFLFMAAVGLLFAPLAPLVPLAAAVVFWIGSWVYKYQLMYAYTTRVESGGKLWNVVVNRLLFSLMLMQALMVLTIGLQYNFKSYQWLVTTPPLIAVLVFKFFLKRKFQTSFHFFIPTEDELRNAHIHGRSDISGRRLESRFEHPALQAELFTPMVHAKMIPLLRQVYPGKITEEKTRTNLNEYGGQKANAQVIEGITLAAIEQSDLAYDPILYQRDRCSQYDMPYSSSGHSPRAPSEHLTVSTRPSSRGFPEVISHPATTRLPRQASASDYQSRLSNTASSYSSPMVTPMPMSPASGIMPSYRGTPSSSPYGRQTDYFDPYGSAIMEEPLQYPSEPPQRASRFSSHMHSPTDDFVTRNSYNHRV
ncbi:hypothetical protein PQX77_002554 [Marasmius sp. AFHP31]|nr:hypothetical protein PQX77_002554 [Marasmius sp. AFHP31]